MKRRPQIFLSYRRDDASAHAGRLYDHLTRRFGEDCVFRDIDTVQPGDDFVEVIHRRIAECSACLVVIGRNWAGEQEGSRRLDDPDDYVRLEVAAALRQSPSVKVIPVLVDGARMPSSATLPEDLARLARLQAVELGEGRFREDFGRLANALEMTRDSRRPPLLQFALPLLLIALVSAGIWMIWRANPRTETSAISPAVSPAAVSLKREVWNGTWKQESSGRGGSSITSDLTLAVQPDGSVEGHLQYVFEGRQVRSQLDGSLNAAGDRLDGIWRNSLGQSGRYSLRINEERTSFEGLYSVSPDLPPENPDNWWRGRRP